MVQMFEDKYGLEVPILRKWTDQRDELIKEWQKSHPEISKGQFKQAALSILNGGFKDARDIESKFEGKMTFMSDLRDEVTGVVNHIKELEAEDYEKFKEIKRKSLSKEAFESKNIGFLYTNTKLTQTEANMLEIAIQVFKDEGLVKNDLYTKIHDGFQYCKHVGDNLERVKRALKLANKEILKQTGFIMKFEEKTIAKQVTFKIEDIKTSTGKPLKFSTPEYREDKSVPIPKFKTYHVCYFDTETYQAKASDNIWHHKVYMISYTIDGVKQPTLDIRNLNGEDKSKILTREFLSKLPDKTTLMAHNADFDYRFLIEELQPTDNVVLLDNKFMAGKFKYHQVGSNKTIDLYIKDTYAHVPERISNFSKTFKLQDDGNKEVIPYELYNHVGINIPFANVKRARKVLMKENPLTWKEKLDQLLNNIDNLGLWVQTQSDDEDEFEYDSWLFDHWKYAKFYCERDVEILMRGLELQRQNVLKISTENIIKSKTAMISLDIDKIISVSAFGQKLETQTGAFEGVVPINKAHMRFIQKSVYGGRTNTMENKAIKVNAAENTIKIKELNKETMKIEERNLEGYNTNELQSGLADSDYNSLYPSAIASMEGYARGKPKVIPKDCLNYEWLEEQSCYFVEIRITKVGKHIPNAILPIQIDETIEVDGNVYTKNENIYDDRIWVGRTMIVNDIDLNELIKYHKIEYEIIQGLYYNEGFNRISKEIINKVYAIRKKCKEEGKQIQATYKLLMNSMYGKKVMKERETKTKIIRGLDNMREYLSRNNALVESCIQINNDDVEDENKMFIVKTHNRKSEHKNYAHVGSRILSMSKRLMNNEIQLAQEINTPVLYQDTDSMFIPMSGLAKLKKQYRRKFKKDLEGKNLGQMSSDFELPEKNDKSYEPRAIRSYFIAKKVYCNVVEYKDLQGNLKTYETYRMKGVSKGAIEYYASENNITVEQIYERLYDGLVIDFDLAKSGKVTMRKHKNMRISNLSEFTRNVDPFRKLKEYIKEN